MKRYYIDSHQIVGLQVKMKQGDFSIMYAEGLVMREDTRRFNSAAKVNAKSKITKGCFDSSVGSLLLLLT